MRILAAGEPISIDQLGLTAHSKEWLEKNTQQALRLVLHLRAHWLAKVPRRISS